MPVIMCSSCKARIECPHCSIGLNLHNKGNLVCHYCGYIADVPTKCPQCESDDIIKIGAGTQKIEEQLEKMFSKYNIFRLDQDSASKKNVLFDVVNKMENSEIDILLGTQMVSKGFDFKKVEVVGILLADIGMNMPDFRAAERIYSLLTQVTGRAGRGEVPGKVIIQTLNEKNDIFKYLLKQDYKAFYDNEIEVRSFLQYPPYSRMARLLIRGIDENDVEKSCDKIFDIVSNINESEGLNVKVMGPSRAPFYKISRNYRQHLILKDTSMGNIRKIIKSVKEQFKPKNTYLEIDIDPLDIL